MSGIHNIQKLKKIFRNNQLPLYSSGSRRILLLGTRNYMLSRPAIPLIRFSTDLFVTIMGKIGSYILHQFVEIICILKIKRR